MDCAGLRADIDKLKQELQALETNVEKIRATEEHAKELQDVRGFISSDLLDLTLGKYLKDFREQNSEILLSAITIDKRIAVENESANGILGSPINSIVAIDDKRILVGGGEGIFYTVNYDGRGKLVLGERIKAMDANGKAAFIESIATTNNGHVLIGGGMGVFYDGVYDDFGRLSLGRRIDLTDVNGNPANICSIETTKDGHVLVGGEDGVLYSGSYDDQGELKLGGRIDLTDVNGNPANICSIETTKDGHVLIGGKDGVLYSGSYDDQGELKLGGRIDIEDAFYNPESFYSIVAADDGRVLFGGDGGTFCSGFYDEEGELVLDNNNILLSIEDADGDLAHFRAIATTKDGYVLIGGKSGVFYIGLHNGQGELKLSKRIDIRDARGEPAHIFSIATMDDGRVLIGGAGELYMGSCGISVETLKQYLPEIIKKGNA